MTVKEKRKALDKYCEKRICADCKLTGKSVCKCGNGYSFAASCGSDQHISDAEVIGAYEMLFGHDDDAYVTDDDLIIIKSPSGRMVDNIVINFKEEN